MWLHGWCFISILQGVFSSPLLISDKINTDPARRTKMRRAIGRMLRAKRMAIEPTSWPEKRIGPIDMTDVMLNEPKTGTPKAVKGDLLA